MVSQAPFVSTSLITATPAYFNEHVKHGRRPIPLGPAVPYAYGFLIDRQLQRRWALHFFADMFKEDLASSSPEQVEDTIDDLIGLTRSRLAIHIHRQMPQLRRCKNRLVPLYQHTDEGYYMFIVRDNSSIAAANAPVSPEDIDALRQQLGVPNQEPAWYRVV